MKFAASILVVLVALQQSSAQSVNMFQVVEAAFQAAIQGPAIFLDAVFEYPGFAETIQLYCHNPFTGLVNQVYWNDPNITTKINITYPITYTIHGWLDSGYSRWWLDVAGALAQHQDMNVCRVSWNSLSAAPYVWAATRNTRIVGYLLNQFILWLATKGGPSYQETNLVGHSLGAHIAGYVGMYSGGQIRKIFGIDPAGPAFTFPFAMPLEWRLDATDARQVIIVHSSDFMLGVTIPCGDQDFYGNAGFFPQKGCTLALFWSDYGLEPITCSHFRALEWFKRCLTPGSNYKAVKCDGRINYFERRCNIYDTNTLEWNVAESVTGQFYFSTGVLPDSVGTYW